MKKNEFIARWGFAIFLALFLVIFALNMTSARATSAVQRVADIYPGATGSSPRFMTVFNNKLYFAANGNVGAGRTMWVYDGINSPSDIWSEMPNSSPHSFGVFNNKLYISAAGNNNAGVELWEYDGITPLVS